MSSTNSASTGTTQDRSRLAAESASHLRSPGRGDIRLGRLLPLEKLPLLRVLDATALASRWVRSSAGARTSQRRPPGDAHEAALGFTYTTPRALPATCWACPLPDPVYEQLWLLVMLASSCMSSPTQDRWDGLPAVCRALFLRPVLHLVLPREQHHLPRMREAQLFAVAGSSSRRSRPTYSSAGPRTGRWRQEKHAGRTRAASFQCENLPCGGSHRRRACSRQPRSGKVCNAPRKRLLPDRILHLDPPFQAVWTVLRHHHPGGLSRSRCSSPATV